MVQNHDGAFGIRIRCALATAPLENQTTNELKFSGEFAYQRLYNMDSNLQHIANII